MNRLHIPFFALVSVARGLTGRLVEFVYASAWVRGVSFAAFFSS
ncbi:hypothetical protein MPNT_20106 [Candidatus Methylacidithermus pantelleriae]|uniref:Uncharacterized protein n=1 Tax=Candidatus Methylacidithermus pantelleriae TaxID=2744239 RepID=A0A8J2BLD3_9BACT|nr:hypothetical protein MPNT_20106 [Candidatus Methylacidithermus pantelleriae]